MLSFLCKVYICSCGAFVWQLVLVKRIHLWCLTRDPSFLSQSLPHPADVSYAMKQSDYEEEESTSLSKQAFCFQNSRALVAFIILYKKRLLKDFGCVLQLAVIGTLTHLNARINYSCSVIFIFTAILMTTAAFFCYGSQQVCHCSFESRNTPFPSFNLG